VNTFEHILESSNNRVEKEIIAGQQLSLATYRDANGWYADLPFACLGAWTERRRLADLYE